MAITIAAASRRARRSDRLITLPMCRFPPPVRLAAVPAHDLPVRLWRDLDGPTVNAPLTATALGSQHRALLQTGISSMIDSPKTSSLNGLVELSRRDDIDIKPTLLRVLTDLYVHKPNAHRRRGTSVRRTDAPAARHRRRHRKSGRSQDARDLRGCAAAAAAAACPRRRSRWPSRCCEMRRASTPTSCARSSTR